MNVNNDRFAIIVITRPEFIDNEAAMITEMLHRGVDRVHIRKPESSLEEVYELIQSIPKELHSRLTLHQYPEILNVYPRQFCPGFHLNVRYPIIPETAWSDKEGLNVDPIISKSCHSLREAEEASRVLRIHYQTLSPIFDSISKAGYSSRFDLSKIRVVPHGTVALGGMTPERIPIVRKRGFSGAAFLGYVWDRMEQDRNFSVIDEILAHSGI